VDLPPAAGDVGGGRHTRGGVDYTWYTQKLITGWYARMRRSMPKERRVVSPPNLFLIPAMLLDQIVVVVLPLEFHSASEILVDLCVECLETLGNTIR